MVLQKGTVNGHPCVVDSAATTVAVTDVNGDGGDIVAATAALVANKGWARMRSFNVQAYGAMGDSRKVTDAVLTGSSSTVTSATAAFTSSDVGKIVYGVETASGLLRLPRGTVTAVNSATSITVSTTATGSYSSIVLVLGTDDTTAIQNAVIAAQATNPPGRVYLPAGGYLFNKALINYTNSVIIDGIAFDGDGSAQTYLFLDPSFDVSTTASGRGALGKMAGSAAVTRFRLSGFTIDGCGYTVSGATAIHVIQFGGAHSSLDDVRIISVKGFSMGFYVATSHNRMNRLHVEGAGGDAGIYVAASSNYFRNCYSGNNTGLSFHVINVLDTSLTAPSVVWSAGVIDESNAGGAYLSNSDSVCFCDGATLYGPSGQYALTVDGTSVGRVDNCKVEAFSTSGNRGGAKVLSGGVLHASQTKFAKAGTLYSIDNAGTFYDLGGNTLGTVNGTAAVGPTLAGLSVTGAAINFTGLPTSDPAVAGRLWNSAGTLKVSAG